jgi:dTDP-glucose pyrophosphorylase
MDALILLKQVEDPTKFGVATLITHTKKQKPNSTTPPKENSS